MASNVTKPTDTKKGGKDAEKLKIEETLVTIAKPPDSDTTTKLPTISQAIEDIQAASNGQNGTEIQKILKLLQVMHLNYKDLKLEYEHGSKFYHNVDLLLFSIPLIILQTLLGMIQHIVGNTTHAKLITSVLAILATLLIGIQLKLAWVGTSKKYEGSARAYRQLEVEARTLYLSLSTAIINNSLSVPDALQTFSSFVQSSRKIETAVALEKPETACCKRRKPKKTSNGDKKLYTALNLQHDPLGA